MQQAESQAEKDDWIACLQAGIGAALDIHHHIEGDGPDSQSVRPWQPRSTDTADNVLLII